MEWNILIKNAYPRKVYLCWLCFKSLKEKQLIETIIYLYFGCFFKIFKKVLKNQQYREKQQTNHDKYIRYNIQKILKLNTLIRSFLLCESSWSIKWANIYEGDSISLFTRNFTRKEFCSPFLLLERNAEQNKRELQIRIY